MKSLRVFKKKKLEIFPCLAFLSRVAHDRLSKCLNSNKHFLPKKFLVTYLPYFISFITSLISVCFVVTKHWPFVNLSIGTSVLELELEMELELILQTPLFLVP